MDCSMWPPCPSQSLPKFMSIKSVMPSNHLILCRPLLLWPSIFPSIRVFSRQSAVHLRWPKFWSFSFSISCSNEYSGLISFGMDWFGLLVVQGTLKSLLQHHNLKACLRRSAFLMVQLVAGIYWMSGFLLSSHNLRPEGQVWEFPFTDEGSEMQTGWVIHSRSGACAGVPAKSACLPSSSLT